MPRAAARATLSPATRALLDPARGRLQPPVRAEIFGAERLAEHGRHLGATHRGARAGLGTAGFFPRVEQNVRVLREAHRYIGTQATRGHDMSPAAEWLLDNFHLVEAQLVEIHESMPRSYFRTLPLLQDPPLAGLPRVYGVAWAFVTHTDGRFDTALLVGFLQAYQTACELTLGEIWALPSTLRVVLIENLRRLAEREAAQQAARALADQCCDAIDSTSVESLDAQLRALRERGLEAAFLAQVALRLRDPGAPPHEHVDAWLHQVLPDAVAAQAQAIADQTADNLSVSNVVGSLRAIGDADWTKVVSSCSPLIALMRTAPVFDAEHPLTRDQTLHAIERLARRSGRGELHVARTLLKLLGPEADSAAASPGHWLDGPGQPALLKALGLPADGVLRRAWRPATRGRLALPAYLGLAFALTTAGTAWVLMQHGLPEARWLLALTALLLALPVSEAAFALIHRLVSESATPQPLPRLAFTAGLPADQRVLVAVPAMLGDPASIDALARQLRLHHLANPERHAQFVLLADPLDADAAESPRDAALRERAIDAIDRLNAQHPAPPGEPPRFVLLLRERRFSGTEGRWIGWERKRGKLEELLQVLGGPGHGRTPGGERPFVDLGERSRLAAGTRYVVTLDSDTVLPPGRLRDLVGVAAHPLNRPRVDLERRRVTEGYAILQPRVQTPLPAPLRSTPFHWLFAGQRGIDPYGAASSEIYQDLFREGSFAGKGLLDVAALNAVLGGRLPPERVLSHDLLEGAFARCAGVGELTLVEDAPYRPDAAAARVHRWTRGDWQLLPFILAPWRWPIGALNRWKMIDNLRRSLVVPAAMALLAMSIAGLGVTPAAALGVLLAALGTGPLLGALAGFVPRRSDLAWRHFLQHAALELARAVGTAAWGFAQALTQTLQALDAIGRTLWRLLVTQRHLLQWTPSSAVPDRAGEPLSRLLWRHRATPLAAAALLAAAWALDTATPITAAVLCGLWALSPLALWWGGQPFPRPGAGLSTKQKAQLEGIAHDTWRYFERVVTADDHFLPPDNLQSFPHEMLARRTSPTNIGLYLLATACARRFGWITRTQMRTRLRDTLASMAMLQRHRGHFLNWYDTQTLAPLLPMVVSTVDSGNLSGHLLATAQACLEQAALAEAEGVDLDDARALRAIAHDCTVMAWAPEWGFLYHRQRHLLHIGYRVAEQSLDDGFYDLLASEARLTSLLAIAKGDVPVRHWSALGRPFYAVGATAGLRSWSGSMFEYLMPSLVLDEPHDSLLREACLAAVDEQIVFAEARGVPWGLSESAYAASDHTLAYQYAPQGAPRLALRRTPPDDLVIAPYATALAAQVAPRRAHANFMRLQALQARTPLGFIEALDYTPSRQAGDAPFTPVRTCMAHHQGMTVVALANVLLDGVARDWGMADPHLQAVAPLLHERAPAAVSTLRDPPAFAPPARSSGRAPGLHRLLRPGALAVEPTQLLSNGRYHVALRANGAGHSRWGRLGLTRTRDDALRDACGSFVYLRLANRPTPVSVTRHPAGDPDAQHEAVFHPDRVVFETTSPGLHVRMTVWVSPEDDIEFRQVELGNTGDDALQLDLLSAFEPTLADPKADEAHPAFGNLFVRAGWQAAQQALIVERVPRLETERRLHVAHFVIGDDAQIISRGLQTDRLRWRGRQRVAGQPLADFDPLPEHDVDPGQLVTGLDPVCALSVGLRIEPGTHARLTFATAASDDRGTLHAIVDKYRQAPHAERASLMSSTLAGVRARSLRMGVDDLAAVQTLSSALLATLTRARPLLQRRLDDETGPCDHRRLWRFGIPGDRPMIGLTANAVQGLGLLRTMAQAVQLWNWHGVDCDVVIVNTEAASYQMPLQRALTTLHELPLREAARGPQTATLHVLRAEDLSSDDWRALRRRARLWLQADGRPLAHHVMAWSLTHEQAAMQRRAHPRALVGDGGPVPVLMASPARGHFEGPGGRFAFEVRPDRRPPRPWVNVMANEGFGTMLSEAGGGYTWARNSRLHQLTAWSNDPVVDPVAEHLLLQDLRTREAWSVTPGPHGAAGARYRVGHQPGSTTIEHQHGDLEVHVTWCVDPVRAVKQVHLRLLNVGRGRLQLRVVGLVEWMMGAARADRATVATKWVDGTLLATQHEAGGGFGQGTAFLAFQGETATDWTGDRRECLDDLGRLVLPERFGQRSGPGLDPCGAIAVERTLAPGASAECTLLLGHGDSPEGALDLAREATAVSPASRRTAALASWEALLGALTVKTPDPLFDVMVNRWLLYQTVACRLWAKAGFYQAGGATGFRDQLQDTMALAWAAPQRLRAQILLCASRQFPEGDVQHWWHAPGGAGVRTHFSDDLLWLVEATVHYLRSTGDHTLLDEPVAFLESPPVPAGAEDLYNVPAASPETATLYEHAARTLDRSLATGAHGLPLMGTGDWNDGMNRVGHEGRGESVWLAWFLCRLVVGFVPVARARGDLARADRWEAAAVGWRSALAGPAWDGAWFRRAFFDDGGALGSSANAEARIDLIAQAWAVLSDAAPATRQRQAMAAVDVLLADHDAGLLRLLDPPLAHAQPNAGYIQAYPPGVRENGGQYSHAGVWSVMARTRLAREAGEAGDVAYRHFTWLSPAHRSAHPVHGAAYGLEPYAVAGDVCSQAPYVGRGGWSWYTGAAGWLHRAAVESFFGLRLEGDALHFVPCLPATWPQAELTLRREGRTMHFVLRREAPGMPGASERLLPPGEPLNWRELGAGEWHFVVPLPRTATPRTPAVVAA